MRKIAFLGLIVVFLTSCAFSAFAQEGKAQKGKLFAALEEIQPMIKELDDTFAKHRDVLQDRGFMKCYYVKRGGIPEEALEKPVFVIDKNGEIGPFPEWLSHDLAWASDLSCGGPVLPGLSSGDGERMQIGVLKIKLQESMAYLQRNSEFYTKHSADSEMNYLRQGMDKWRRHIVDYHNALDDFLAGTAEFIKYSTYDYHRYNKLYDEAVVRCDSLPERSAEKAKCQIERDEYAKKRDEARHKAEYELATSRVRGASYTQMKRLSDAKVIFENLENVFGADLLRIRVDNDMILEKQKRLQDKELDETVRKTCENDIKALKKDMNERLNKLRKERGQNCLDALRDPKTGAIRDGGELKDRGVDAVKVLANEKAGKIVWPIGGLKPKGPAKKEPLPEDKFYTFISGCGKYLKEAGSPKEWGSGQEILDDGTVMKEPVPEEPGGETAKEEARKKCLGAYARLNSATDQSITEIKNNISTIIQNRRMLLDEFDSIFTVVTYDRVATSDEGWHGKAEEIRKKAAQLCLGCDEYKGGRGDINIPQFLPGGSFWKDKTKFLNQVVVTSSFKIDKYSHADFVSKTEPAVDAVFHAGRQIEQELEKMRNELAAFDAAAQDCAGEEKPWQERKKCLQIILQIEQLNDQHDNAFMEIGSYATKLSQAMEAIYKKYDDDGEVDVANLETKILNAHKACPFVGRAKRAMNELDVACDDYKRQEAQLRNLCENCSKEKEKKN